MDGMKITEPGIYALDEATYHRDDFLPEPSLSSSGARKMVNDCPAQFWADRLDPPTPTASMVLGRAAHAWLLEGDRWAASHAVLPEDHNGRTKDGKAMLDEIEASGRTPIKHADFVAIKGMKEALEAHPFAAAAFQDGRSETTLIWRDDEFDIWCRCRPDFFPRSHPIIADYKTTVSAKPDDIRKSMFNFGYHMQAQWYLEGVRKLGLLDEPRFLFIFQQTKPPYLITAATPDHDALIWGETQNRKAKAMFAHGLRTGQWPGYADDILTLALPGWANYQLLEKSEAGAFETHQPEAA